MHVELVVVGKLKETWQKDGCREYLKRLTRYGRFDVTEVDDCPEPAGGSAALERQVLAREGERILKRIRETDRVVALCVEGPAPDSVALSEKLARWAMDGRRVVFVIGGSLGLSEAVLARADERLSCSNLTFPHGLMRVILLEQLYRAAKILAGERYHK